MLEGRGWAASLVVVGSSLLYAACSASASTAPSACPPTHTCCIAGSDPDGLHCTCYADTYLSQLSMTCEERAAPDGRIVTYCPEP